jgi:hypothetical protein
MQTIKLTISDGGKVTVHDIKGAGTRCGIVQHNLEKILGTLVPGTKKDTLSMCEPMPQSVLSSTLSN